MSEVSFDSIPAERAIGIVYESGHEYKLAVEKFVCPSCSHRMTEVHYVDETVDERSGIQVLSLGVTCPSCGETILHLAY